MFMWTSSRSSDHANVPPSISAPMAANPSRIAASSASVMIPVRASMAAWARLPHMSWRHSRWSKLTDALIARMITDGPSAKRPPQCWFVEVVLGMDRGVMASVLIPRRRLPATALLLAAPPATAQAARTTGIEKLREASRPAAAIAFTDAEGRERTLADFAGSGLVINLWATWCPPCVAEMPALDRLQAMLAGEGIAVLALSSDRGGRAQVEPFYARVGIRNLAIWLDPRGAAGRAMGVRGLPTTVLVDRRGMERARLEGEAEWDAPPLVAAVRRLVA